MIFMNGIPPTIAQHVRTLGIRRPEEQVDAAQGYFDVRQGTIWSDNEKKEDKDSLLVKTLQGLFQGQGESKEGKPAKEWKKERSKIQDLSTKLDRLVGQIEKLATRENQSDRRYPP